MLGPEKLYELSGALGKAYGEMRRAVAEVKGVAGAGEEALEEKQEQDGTRGRGNAKEH